MYACVHQMKSSEVHKGTDLAECIGMDLCQLHLVNTSSAVALPGVCRALTATILTQEVSVEKIRQCMLLVMDSGVGISPAERFIEPDGKRQTLS
jgi:hypothetical protein